MKDDQNLKPWTLNSSEPVIDDKFFKLRANSYTTPGGAIIEPYYLIEGDDWVNCFVIDDELNAVMVEHYRPGANDYLYELVSGGLDPADDNPEEGIRRELLEEVGYEGGKVHQIGVSFANPGRQTQKIYSFIAFGGRCSAKPQLEVGENLRKIVLPFDELLASVRGGDRTYQSYHIATTLFAINFIETSDDPFIQKVKQRYGDSL